MIFPADDSFIFYDSLGFAVCTVLFGVSFLFFFFFFFLEFLVILLI